MYIPYGICVYMWYTYMYVYYIFSIHSSVDKLLGCFHILVITNSAVMNVFSNASSYIKHTSYIYTYIHPGGN